MGGRRRCCYVAGVARVSGAATSSTIRCSPTWREEKDYDLVSGYGYSLGYLGGGLLFLVNVLMVTKPAMFGIADASEGVRLSFVTVGIWWVLFTLPVLFWVQEERSADALPDGRRDSRGRSLSSPAPSGTSAATRRCCGFCWRTGSTSTA